MGDIFGKRRRALLIGCAIAVASLWVSPAAAGCNSGNAADADLLSSAECQASAPGANSLAVGLGAQAGQAGGTDDTALGAGAVAGGVGGSANTAVGADATAGGTDSNNNTAIGANTNANDGSIAIGGADSSNDAAEAIGTNSIAIGIPSTATATQSTALGFNSRALGDSSVAIGLDSLANQAGNIALGGNAVSAGVSSTAIGHNSGSAGLDSAAFGSSAVANGDNAVALGSGSFAGAASSIAIGAGAVANQTNQVVLGTSSHTYTAPGITSSLSKARQSGPLEIVTSDANGNLATDGGRFFNQLNNDLKRIDENQSGVALAMSLQNPDLTGNERFGVAANWGNFEGANALGMSLMGVLGNNFITVNDRVAISGGFGVGFSDGDGSDVYGGRVGLQWTR